jgi:hypothetical protein
MRVLTSNMSCGLKAAAAAAAMAAMGLAVSMGAAADDASIPAVWKEQRVDFVYFGQTSRYTCTGIRDKLRAILRTLGARRDISAVAVGCDDTGGPHQLHNQSPSVHLVFSAPSAPEGAARPVLDARYEAFWITADAFRNMELGDCELVEDFMRQVLPKLATRNVRQDITCIPYQLSGSHYSVRGEVLKEVPATAAGTRQ